MPIECHQWPMDILTRASGEKNRILLVHPKPAIERKGIRRGKDGKLQIIDSKAVRIVPGMYYPEMKEAGHRHFLACDKKGKYYCFGRRLNVENTYTDIYPKIKEAHLPILERETVIDFELVWPGHPDSEVVTAIKECPEELECRIFGIPFHKGQDLRGIPYKTGRNILRQHFNKCEITTRYTPVEITLENKVQKLTWLLNEAERLGVEGFVLKGAHYGSWYKLKGINEADVFVIGFKVSDAETRKGMITAVKVGVIDENNKPKYIGNVSGFNLEEMGDLAKAYNEYGESKYNPQMFRVLRIIYQEMAGKGGLKHAFRDCWRDDKNWQDCNIKQFD